MGSRNGPLDEGCQEGRRATQRPGSAFLVRQVFRQINQLFTDNSKLQAKFGLTPIQITSEERDAHRSETRICRSNEFQAHPHAGGSRNHRSVNIVKKFFWAINYHEKFEKLVDELNYSVGSLCDLLPAEYRSEGRLSDPSARASRTDREVSQDNLSTTSSKWRRRGRLEASITVRNSDEPMRAIQSPSMPLLLEWTPPRSRREEVTQLTRRSRRTEAPSTHARSEPVRFGFRFS